MRVLRWLGLGVLLLVVLVAGALAYALSHHGLNTLAHWGLKKYNATIVGQVNVADVQRHGTALHLRGVSVLYKGEVVAQVEEVKVQPNWKTLRPSHIDIRTFDVLRPALLLAKDPIDGKFTIAKALEPKEVKPKKPPSTKTSEPPTLRLGRLRVEDAAIRYVGPPQEVAVANLDVDLHTIIAWPRIDALDLSVNGQLEKPERLPFRLKANAAGVAPLAVDAKVAFAVDDGVVKGIAIKGVALDAELKQGIATISRLQANVDGNQVNVSGRAGPLQALTTPFSVQAAVDLANLERTAGLVRSFGFEVPPLAGSGSLAVSAQGTPSAPAVKAKATFSNLQAATMTVQRLELSPVDGSKLANEHRLVLQGVKMDKQALGTVTVQAGLSGPQTLQGSLAVQHPAAQVQAQYEVPLLALKADNMNAYPLRLDLSAAVPSLRKAARAFGVAAPDADGNVQASMTVRGSWGGAAFPDVAMKVNARRLRVGAQAVGDVVAAASVPAGQGINATVDLQNPQAADRSHVEMRARWRRPLDVRDAEAWRAAIMRMTYEADVDVKGANLAALKALAAPSLPPQTLASVEGLQGSAGMQAHVVGTATTVRGKLNMLVEGVRTNRVPATNVNLHTELASTSANLDLRVTTVADKQEARLAFAGRWPRPLDIRNPGAVITRMTFETDVDVKDANLAALKTLAQPSLPPTSLAALDGLQGSATLQVHAVGTMAAVQGKVSLLFDRVRTKRFPATNVNLQTQLTGTDAKLSLRVDTVAKGHEARLVLFTAEGKPAAGRTLDPKAWKHAQVKWQGELGPLRMQQIQALSPQPSQFAMETVQGRFHVLMSGQGTLPAPNAHVELNVSQIKRGERALGDVQIKADYEKMVPSLIAHLTSANGGTLHLDAHTTKPLPLSPLPAREALPPVDVDVAATQFNLALFDGWVESLRGVGGMMQGHLSVGGTMASPKFAGNLSVKDGSMEIIEVARLEDIDVRVKAAPGELILEAFNFESGSGRGEMSAKLTRTGKDAMALRGDIKLRRFPLQAPQRKLGELDLNAGWTGSLTLAKLTIDPLHIREARAYVESTKTKALQDLDRPDDVVLFQGGKPASKTERKKYAELIAQEVPIKDEPEGSPPSVPLLPSFGTYPMFIHVKAPRNLWVRSKEGSIELGLSDDFMIERKGALEIYGSVLLRRGRLNVFGRDLDIRNTSKVTFMGDPANPELDVTVDHEAKTPAGATGATKYQIIITVKGRADNLSVKFTSIPALPQTDIISLLVTGRRTSGGGGGGASQGEPGAQAAALAGGFIASKLRGTILRRLPVDVLSISANAIEAGTYVTDRLYVGYVRRLLAQPWRYENQNALHLEYQLTSRWSFEGEYGDVGSGMGDLVWKKLY